MPDFETNAMKNLEAQVAELEKQNAGNISDVWNKYIDSLKALNKATREQYRKDSFGLDRKFTPEKLAEFKKLYEDCGSRSELTLYNFERYKGQPVYQILENINNMLSDDLKMLNAVDPKTLEDGTVSLQKIVDDSRVRKVDISGQNLGTVGANMSSRIPFNYVEPDGKQMPGVFTPKSVFDIDAGTDELINDVKRAYPEMGAFFEEYKKASVERSRGNVLAKGKDPDKFTPGEYAIKALQDLRTKKEFDNFTVLDGFSKTLPPEKFTEFHEFWQKPENFDAIQYLIKKTSKYVNSVGVNLGNARIGDKSRIDSRNSAMSAVADMLGVPDLICRAVPMKVVQDGKEIEGTFMGLAEGVDIKAPAPECSDESYKPEGPVFANSKGYKDVADLQILDFICGNVDRHAGNMFYKFDNSDPDLRNHKFLGVQGIDNDASFGTFVPKDNWDDNRTCLTSLNNLKVISNSMAKKVVSLEPDILEFTLRNRGLSEEQVKAAGKRLDMLKKYIIDSAKQYENLGHRQQATMERDKNIILADTVRIIGDDEFTRIDLSRMLPSNGRPNGFGQVYFFRRNCIDEKKENPTRKPVKPQKIEEKQVYVLKEEELRWAKYIENNLNTCTQAGRTSTNYKAVQAAAVRYRKFCETNKGMVLSEDLYDVRDKLLSDLNLKSKVYLQGKQSVKNPKPYTQRRIDAVESIMNETAGRINENFYDNMRRNMSPEDQKRYADGLHAYADRSLDDFNARMRAMAEKIAAKHPEELQKIENKEAAKKAPDPVIG